MKRYILTAFLGLLSIFFASMGVVAFFLIESDDSKLAVLSSVCFLIYSLSLFGFFDAIRFLRHLKDQLERHDDIEEK